ncbi:MAG: hypothetical protein QME64_08000 [bacterium]|nr:hypothetical protein [bacterium]
MQLGKVPSSVYIATLIIEELAAMLEETKLNRTKLKIKSGIGLYIIISENKVK